MDNNGIRADLDKKASEVAGMFDSVAERYDLMNALMTGGLDRAWRVAARKALNPQFGEKILDVAAGTGASSIGLYNCGADVTCCDFSAGMVNEGRRRYPELVFVEADAHDLPFANAEFDAVTCSFGFRNMHTPSRALEEFLRVTKPGGRLTIVEFSTPPNPLVNAGRRAYMQALLPVLGKLASSNAPAYEYLLDSVLAWPDQRELAGWLSAAGWQQVQWRNLTFGTVAIHRAFKPLEA